MDIVKVKKRGSSSAASPYFSIRFLPSALFRTIVLMFSGFLNRRADQSSSIATCLTGSNPSSAAHGEPQLQMHPPLLFILKDD
nr:hypothetical protein [Fictibacillus barbaricus]